MLHISYFVRLYGPLHSFSMVKFENFKRTRKIRRGFYEAKKFNNFVLDLNDKDGFVAIALAGKMIPCRFLRHLTTSEGVEFVEVSRCLNTKSFYTWPLDSKQLGEISYESLSTMKETFPKNEVSFKYCRIPYEDIFVIVPILHTASLRYDSKVDF